MNYPKNPLIAYLNINSLRNKIIDVGDIMSYLSPNYLVLSETKLDDSFPSAQFSIPDYEVRARRDRHKNGGGLIEFVKKGLICKRLKNFETTTSECIYSEITISKRKWLCFSIYRPTSNENLEIFFEELTNSLSKASESYEHFIIMGDFSIDITNKGVELDKLDEFCDLFNLTNLITSPTCFTKTHKSTIELILTKKESYFQKTKVTETGLSDFHKLISTFLRSQFCRLKPEKIYYRNFKNFNEENFLEEVKNTDFRLNSDDPNESYELITKVFSNIVEKHAPLKKKFLRGNQAPFMTKEFRKAIYNRSRLRNKFCKIPSEENEKLYKKQRNRCVAIRKKSIRNYFNKIANRNIVTNRNFWKIIKPLLSNKGHLENVDIMLNHNNKIICNDHELVKIFNEHYINIIEKSGGEKPTNITEEYSFDNDKKAIEIICNSYKNHPSIL